MQLQPVTGDDAAIYDCWNRIGVRGDKSCPELVTHSHCRNCPAYSAAAMSLLDRERDGAATPAAIAPFAGTAGLLGERGTVSAIVFRVGSEWFALSTIRLDEIVSRRAIHSLPHRRNPAVLGLANVRGELVVCVSIARLLIGEGGTSAGGRLVVMRHAGGRLAFPVDEVQHTHRYRPDDVRPAPVTVARSASHFTRGVLTWREHMVGCLDEERVFDALNRSLA